MHYLVPFRTSSFFYAALSLAIIIILSEYDSSNNNDNNNNNIVISPQPFSHISHLVQVAAAVSTTTTNCNLYGKGGIIKIQLPGIIPSINNSISPTSPPPLLPTPPISKPPLSPPPPPPIIHNTRAPPAPGGPTLNDPNLKVEQILTGLKLPTSMAFLEPNDILVLEKDTGIVHRVLNGKLLPEPVLRVPVATEGERGLLGIAIAKNNGNDGGGPSYAFLYYTESGGGKTGDDAPNNSSAANTNTNGSGIPPAGNRLYRYNLDLNNVKLTNPLMLLNLPATPPPGREGTEKNHNGGKVLIGPDNNVYIGIGDVAGHNGQSENNPTGIPPDGTGGILRVTQDGQIVDNPPLGNGTLPLALYYAYGMRNTFGMDFDPLTGDLWDTENGNTFGDEINLVKPGFNSGWSQVAGIWEAGSKPGPAIGTDSNNPPKDLVTFGGKGAYRAPELATLQTIGPTALKFLTSNKLGRQYENTIFMGDVNTGRLYNFKLSENRTGLVLNGSLSDKTATIPEDLKEGGAVLGQGFGTITDIQVGPDDGYLYILTLRGGLYRIVPSS
jgi:aldose sugar dehydrogenase